MLRIDPSERPTSTEALSHEFFGVYRCPEDEPSGKPIADFEDETASIQEWKSKKKFLFIELDYIIILSLLF